MSELDAGVREIRETVGALQQIRRANRLAGENLLDTAAAEQRLSTLLADDRKRASFEKWITQRHRILRCAVQLHLTQQRAEKLTYEAAQLSTRAAAADRHITHIELNQQAELRESAKQLREDYSALDALENTHEREEALEALATIRVKEARKQLNGGLVLTEQMRSIISEAVPSLTRGEPMLLLGETGGAKTALASYLCQNYLGGSNEIVSGFADMTAGQLMGTYELRVSDGATESVFVDGPLTRAIAQGVPIIIDEINALPPEFLKRLNLILQLRPGDTYQVQEHTGRVITVAPGFVVIATANEHTPNRYRGLERMSAELTNRFGANSYRVHYPDRGTKYDELPHENTLLAYAAAVDSHGELPPTMDTETIERAAKAAFISQQVFAGTQGEGFEQYRTAEHRIDSRPGLEETVLAPRTLVAILRKVSNSAGTVSVEGALARFLESIMHPEDRDVHRAILRSQGFKTE